MLIGFDMEGEPDHETLAVACNTLIALTILDVLKDWGMTADEAGPVSEAVTFALATMFDKGSIRVNAETYRPRVAFRTQAGRFVSGAETFDVMHEFAAMPLDDLEGLEILGRQAGG